jgi:N4-gp56 family major capsid protein
VALLQTGSGGPDELLRNYWKEQLLDILENNLIAADLCDQQVIPANSGNVIEFHRINAFSKQVTGVTQYMAYLQQGTATAGALKGKSFTVDSIVYTLELLTNDLHLTEQSIMTAEPNPVPTLTRRFLYNAKDTIDQRIINMMVSNTGNTQSSTAASVEYMGVSTSPGTVWGDGSQTLTEATLDADNPSHRVAAESFNTAYTNLRARSAKPRAGKRYYDALISPEVAGDLRTDATFQDIALKGHLRGEDKFERAAIGEVFNVLVMEDENVSVNLLGTIDATNDQIVRCPIVGQGYCARISHAKGVGVPQVNFIPPGKVDKSDPYGLIGIMTWKIYQADGGVLNPLAGQLLKVATTRSKFTSNEPSDDGLWDM